MNTTYEKPNMELISVSDEDVIVASGGTETGLYDYTDAVWSIGKRN